MDITDEDNRDRSDTEIYVLEDDLIDVCPNIIDLTNYMVKLFYEDRVSYSKSLLWTICGKQIYENLFKRANGFVIVPERDDEGDIKFIYKKYKKTEVVLNGVENL